MFFYEPIFWLVGLYVNLSPVDIFAFLSSLKVVKDLQGQNQVHVNVQGCKCARM